MTVAMAGHVARAASVVSSVDVAAATTVSLGACADRADVALPSSGSCGQVPPTHSGLRRRVVLSPSPRHHGKAQLDTWSSCSRALVHGAPSTGRRSGRIVSPHALDQDTLLGVAVGIAGIAAGIAIPVFYEMQVKGSEVRVNDQPCFPCDGSGSQKCRFCAGEGVITVDLGGGGESQRSRCINCEGNGTLTCTTCNGTGIQPRYLDRREFKDDD